jgi:hypothetical protein
MGADERLLSLAGELYGGLPADFTPERTAAEKAAKADGDKELAAAVKLLKKPSVGAWAVNLLVRRETEQIDQVLTLAESLRAAAEALDGAELRALTKQRRQLTSALTTRARQLALEHGTRLTQAVADQVEGTLNAAMLDAGAADAVRTGMLVTTLSATGVDEQTWASAGRRAEALGTRIAPAAEAPGPALHVVPENKRLLRETAEEKLAEAEAEVKAATKAAPRRRRPSPTCRASGSSSAARSTSCSAGSTRSRTGSRASTRTSRSPSRTRRTPSRRSGRPSPPATQPRRPSTSSPDSPTGRKRSSERPRPVTNGGGVPTFVTGRRVYAVRL